jgi:hypothetical protein
MPAHLVTAQITRLSDEVQRGSVSDDFRIAVERARKRIGERRWMTLSLHAQSTEIYAELRALDSERVAQQAAPKAMTSGSNGTSN